MKVRTERTRFGTHAVEIELADFLEVTDTVNEGGAFECAQTQIRLTSVAIGRILARMVERNLLTFEEALSIAGLDQWYLANRYGKVTLIP